MTLSDLLASTQKYFVQNQNISISKSIVFTHVETATEEPTFAFVGGVDINDTSKDFVSNKVEFANVFLESEPKANDTILYDGELYSVDKDGWSKQDGLYLIRCSQKRHSGRGGR